MVLNNSCYINILCTVGIGKKIDVLAQKPDCADLALWKQSVVNHLYWAAASTPPGQGDLIVAKWLSVLHHVTDRHHFPEEPIFRQCAHDPLREDERNRAWLEPGKCFGYTVKLALKTTLRTKKSVSLYAGVFICNGAVITWKLYFWYL